MSKNGRKLLKIKPKYEKLNKDGLVNPFTFDVKFEYTENVRIILVSGKREEVSYASDNQDGLKFYRVSKEMEDRMLNLSSGAMRLFLLIVFNLGLGQDRIRLNINVYSKRLGFKTPKSFYNAVRDLDHAGIIKKHRGFVYWINPRIIFKGDRLSKYHDRAVCVGVVKIRDTR